MSKNVKESIVKSWKKISLAGKRKKAVVLGAITAICILLIGIAIAVSLTTGKDEIVSYKKTTVQRGMLYAGITESGSVDIGTTMDTFDLDISEFASDSSFSFAGQGGNAGGMDMMQGMMNPMNGNQPGAGMSPGGGSGSVAAKNSVSSSTRALEVEEVFVDAGEEITVGTPLLKLTKESVDNIRTELAEDVTSAELVYQQALTVQKQTSVQAESERKTNLLYAGYAQTEYDQTIASLQEAVEERQDALTQKQEALEETRAKLEELQTLLSEEREALENAEYAAATTDAEQELYWWIVAWQTKEDAVAMVESLEAEIEDIKSQIKQYEDDIETAQLSLSLAQRDLEKGSIAAKSTLEQRSFNTANVQEIYNVTVDKSNFDVQKSEADYKDAKDKLERFDSVVVDQTVYASENGLVTDVRVAQGDFLMQNTELVKVNDYDAVTVTLSLEEAALDTATLGSKVNITAAAFPDEVFKGTVTEIGDAEIDSNTNKTMYSVTVTIQNAGSLFYQDMTAEITFVTREASEVLYVPNRAVTEENGRFFVQVLSEEGKVQKREVTTGISDGVNTEIREGLSEGETVQWESKVNRS